MSEDDDEETKAMFEKQKEKINAIKARQAARAGDAKSNLTLDIKPTGTDVDLKELEKRVRSITLEGLKWLGSDHIDVAYGVKKIRILCQLVDVLINPDTIREEIEKDEDVQSTDIFAFQMA
jgi:elongation factor 1-beta